MNVTAQMKVAQEEQFGPVVPISVFNQLEEVEKSLIESPFGMQASIFGQDSSIIGPLIDTLSNQVCRINLNTQCQRGPDIFPFTGRKGSAEGTLSVTDALRQFSIRSMVAAKHDASGKKLFRAILEQDHSRFLNTDILL
jgi:glyceraldehyde-3-phosphate dehydrogenase (NADP+)